MSDEAFGQRLYSELRKISGYDLITGMMDYKAIQQLKVSNRDDTVKLFRGSSNEVIQLIKTGEPQDMAQYLVSKAAEAKSDDSEYGAHLLILISSM